MILMCSILNVWAIVHILLADKNALQILKFTGPVTDPTEEIPQIVSLFFAAR